MLVQQLRRYRSESSLDELGRPDHPTGPAGEDLDSTPTPSDREQKRKSKDKKTSQTAQLNEPVRTPEQTRTTEPPRTTDSARMTERYVGMCLKVRDVQISAQIPFPHEERYMLIYSESTGPDLNEL